MNDALWWNEVLLQISNPLIFLQLAAVSPLSLDFTQHAVNVAWGGALAVEFFEKDA
jgi:hypothetical protein